MSRDFPANWRYVPLRLTADRTKWINAISYRKIMEANGFREFKGVDVHGNVYFDDNVIRGHPLMRGGIAELAKRDGYGVGIFMATCRPKLVIIDCDTDVEFVTTGNTSQFVTRSGRNQLLKLIKRHGNDFPASPVVRGNRTGHGYLIFKQNRDYQLVTRKIRPFKLALDVLGNGYQVHWTCGNRELVSGRELLGDPPELPGWFAQLISRHTTPKMPVVPGAFDIDSEEPWSAMLREAVLRPVTPHGPGWNQNLFNAACTLAENGVDAKRLMAVILERCQPNTETDTMMAKNSVASAWRKVTGEAFPDE